MTASGDYRDQLRAYLVSNANPPHKFGHQPRLYLLATQIGAGMVYDDDVVYAAAWLHDLGVFIGHRPDDPQLLRAWDHVSYTNGMAPGMLAGLGFPPAKVPAVLEVIRTHQPHDDPQTLEGLLVRDADILEQLGAIGILRTASKLGSDDRFRLFADAERSLKKASAELPAKIRLDATRTLAAPRIAVLQGFLAALEWEAQGELG